MTNGEWQMQLATFGGIEENQCRGRPRRREGRSVEARRVALASDIAGQKGRVDLNRARDPSQRIGDSVLPR